MPRPVSKRSIAIYCNTFEHGWWGYWGPHSLEAGAGVGGSEEAVILLARAIVALGRCA